MQDQEELRTEKVKNETEYFGLQQYMDTKQSEHKNQVSVVTHLKDARETLIQEVDSLKMKVDRDRNKLKFYKGEYVGFEVHKKSLEDQTDEFRRQIRD